VLVVRPDGFDDEIELVRAVDLPEDAVVLAWREDVGFVEVVQAVNATCRIVSHDEHSTGAAYLAREQKQMIGAEVEHGLEGRARARRLPLAVSAVDGLPGGLLRTGVSHRAAHDGTGGFGYPHDPGARSTQCGVFRLHPLTFPISGA
jgi:hypothetical protein